MLLFFRKPKGIIAGLFVVIVGILAACNGPVNSHKESWSDDISVNDEDKTNTDNKDEEKPVPVYTVTSISITRYPAKTSYIVYEVFDPAGLIITAAFDDGSSKAVSGYSIIEPNMETAGIKTIIITFEGETVDFNITVNSGTNGLEVVIY